MRHLWHKLLTKNISFWHGLTVLLAILIATQVQYIQHGWINPDSVLYLEAAKLFSIGDWKAGFEVFSWPFYALCIALVNTMTQLGVHISAQILNVIFFGIATYSFIKIILLAGGNQKEVIAGALIWLSAQYMIGGVLEMLMRDEGFWAFFLLSIVFFLKHYQNHSIQNAFSWQITIILATLFRIEAIVYLIFLPFVLLFQAGVSTNQKLKNLFHAHAINIALSIAIGAVFAVNTHLSSQLLGRLNEIFTNHLWQEFTQQLILKSNIMSKEVLGDYLDEFAIPGILLTFIFVMLVKTISTTGFINIILSILTLRHKKQLMLPNAYKVLSTTAIIATLIMTLIITKVFVLSGRYVLALSFILMIFSSFSFSDLLFSAHKNKKIKWLSIFLVTFMFVGAIKNILPKKPGYNYMQEGVAWLEQYNRQNKPVFYDQARMRYYANAPFIGVFDNHIAYLKTSIANKSIYDYGFMIIENSNENNDARNVVMKNLPEFILIKQFNDANAKKSVIIYEKK